MVYRCLIIGVCLSALAACQAPADRGEKSMTTPSAETVIRVLDLEQHVEGGYYRRTFQADDREPIMTRDGERYLMTSIHYLLTDASPVGHFHLNRSDIVHYYHLGDPIEYFLLHSDGELERVVMGPDVAEGQRLQLTVRGGIWKASRLLPGAHGYGLISEAVSPGFDFADMTLGEQAELTGKFPQHGALIEALTRH